MKRFCKYCDCNTRQTIIETDKWECGNCYAVTPRITRKSAKTKELDALYAAIACVPAR
jgi:hypothetical protein